MSPARRGNAVRVGRAVRSGSPDPSSLMPATKRKRRDGGGHQVSAVAGSLALVLAAVTPFLDPLGSAKWVLATVGIISVVTVVAREVLIHRKTSRDARREEERKDAATLARATARATALLHTPVK